uniref:Uncharacterized protein n=1 Tax=Oryzias sinensis TaxID=183150 RepID=A0A8C7WUV1_9TELE
ISSLSGCCRTPDHTDQGEFGSLDPRKYCIWIYAAFSFRSSIFLCLFFRQLLSFGLDRRRQLGDIEFSNRYSEFLRSKAKHSSICAFLRRMQGVKQRCEILYCFTVFYQVICPVMFNSLSTMSERMRRIFSTPTVWGCDVKFRNMVYGYIIQICFVSFILLL